MIDPNRWIGKFQSVLYNLCNLQHRYPAFIPIIIHGLKNYDAHFLIQELSYDECDISIIPQFEEKYIYFSKKISNNLSIRFIESYQFLQASLSNLAKTLEQNNFYEKFKYFGTVDSRAH